MPWMAVTAVAQQLAERDAPPEALLTLVIFSAHRRPSEGLLLEVADAVPACAPMSKFVAVNLHPQGRAQTSKTFATNESILLDHPGHVFVGDLLLTLTCAVQVGRLFLFTLAHFSAQFQAAQLGIVDPYTVYQVRHVGPSADKRDNVRSLAKVKKRGRWAALTPLRSTTSRYLTSIASAPLDPSGSSSTNMASKERRLLA